MFYGGDAVLIGRERLIKKMLECVAHGDSLFVSASPGSGKTALLKELKMLVPNSAYALPSNKKGILLKVAKALKIQVKGKNVFELYEAVDKRLEKKSCVLLIDDVHELTKSVKELIEKLIDHGLIVICIGSRNVFNLLEIKMNSLSKRDIEKIIRLNVKNPNPLLVKLLVNNCTTPQEVMLALRKAKNYNLTNESEVKKLADTIRIKKKELLPVWSLAAIISFMLSMRYFFYMKREYYTGYVLALIAYALRALSSLRRR